MNKKKHYEESILVNADPKSVFEYIDNHKNFSSHMNKPSLMMGGGKMETVVDSGNGQKVGSRIKLKGTAFGIPLSLDEAITRYEPPFVKTWETVEEPKLLIIGNYSMGVQIKPQVDNSLLNVSIDYDLPTKNPWLGRLFGNSYSKWCVRQMIGGVKNHFEKD